MKLRWASTKALSLPKLAWVRVRVRVSLRVRVGVRVSLRVSVRVSLGGAHVPYTCTCTCVRAHAHAQGVEHERSACAVHERTGSVASRLCEASSMVSAVHCPSDSGSATSEFAGKEESKQSRLGRGRKW